jgi:hypothetical protein
LQSSVAAPQLQLFQAQLWAAGFLALNFSHMGISAAFSACFIRPIFANIRSGNTAGSGSGLPLTVQRGRQQLRLLGEIKGLHPEEQICISGWLSAS